MRMWHKDLISVLPKQQLVAQWRELNCIIKNIVEKGTPNHLLVNKVTDYSMVQFTAYSNLVLKEMSKRNIKVSEKTYLEFVENCRLAYVFFNNNKNPMSLYSDWMGKRYFIQCVYNLQEKYDCGGVTKAEWKKIYELTEAEGVTENVFT